jgi:hypothetical protein
MAAVEADPALIYAFQKTGVYICEENERWLTKRQLAAWNLLSKNLHILEHGLRSTRGYVYCGSIGQVFEEGVPSTWALAWGKIDQPDDLDNGARRPAIRRYLGSLR